MNHYPWLTAALACLMLTGCRTAVNTTENAEKYALPNAISDSRVIADRGLDSRVRVISLSTKPGPNDFLQLQVEFLNCKNSIQSINCLVEWFDASGMLVSTAGGGWKQQEFMPRESLFVTFTAPTATAKDFRVKMMDNPRSRRTIFR